MPQQLDAAAELRAQIAELRAGRNTNPAAAELRAQIAELRAGRNTNPAAAELPSSERPGGPDQVPAEVPATDLDIPHQLIRGNWFRDWNGRRVRLDEFRRFPVDQQQALIAGALRRWRSGSWRLSPRTAPVAVRNDATIPFGPRGTRVFQSWLDRQPEEVRARGLAAARRWQESLPPEPAKGEATVFIAGDTWSGLRPAPRNWLEQLPAATRDRHVDLAWLMWSGLGPVPRNWLEQLPAATRDRHVVLSWPIRPGKRKRNTPTGWREDPTRRAVRGIPAHRIPTPEGLDGASHWAPARLAAERAVADAAPGDRLVAGREAAWRAAVKSGCSATEATRLAAWVTDSTERRRNSGETSRVETGRRRGRASGRRRREKAEPIARKAQALRVAGFTVRRIADELGVSAAQVGRYLTWELPEYPDPEPPSAPIFDPETGEVVVLPPAARESTAAPEIPSPAPPTSTREDHSGDPPDPPAAPSPPPQSPRSVRAAERRARAAVLRRAGASYRIIGRMVGWGDRHVGRVLASQEARRREAAFLLLIQWWYRGGKRWTEAADLTADGALRYSPRTLQRWMSTWLSSRGWMRDKPDICRREVYRGAGAVDSSNPQEPHRFPGQRVRAIEAIMNGTRVVGVLRALGILTSNSPNSPFVSSREARSRGFGSRNRGDPQPDPAPAAHNRGDPTRLPRRIRRKRQEAVRARRVAGGSHGSGYSPGKAHSRRWTAYSGCSAGFGTVRLGWTDRRRRRNSPKNSPRRPRMARAIRDPASTHPARTRRERRGGKVPCQCQPRAVVEDRRKRRWDRRGWPQIAARATGRFR